MINPSEKTIPAGEFKAKCLRIMDEVKTKRRAITITKRGIPIATLIPAEEQKINLFGAMKGTLTISEDIIKPIDETWEADE